MKRPRFPIAGMMAAVVAVAINLAVIRSIEWTKPDTMAHFFFACGVMPMASVLILVALMSLPDLVRSGRLSPFVLGFEAVGWAVVFAFVTCYSIASPILLAYAEGIGAYTRPVFIRYFADPPPWVGMALELGLGAVIFSLPQLAVALLGGWLTRKFGLTVRFERRGMEEPAARATKWTSDAGGIDPAVPEWRVSH